MRKDLKGEPITSRFAQILGVLAIIFGCRVIAQLVQVWYSLDFLPAFERWHSRDPTLWLVSGLANGHSCCVPANYMGYSKWADHAFAT